MSKPWDALRKRAAEGLVTTSEVVALLDEVERLTVEVDRLGLSCPVAGHDAPVEPVPEGVVQQAVPVRCPHCARELRQALDTLTENLEAAEDRERGWKLQAQVAESEVERLTAERNEARLAHQCSEGTLSMTVDRLGGLVENRPTTRVNFLQRVDELVAMERTVIRLTARLPTGEDVVRAIRAMGLVRKEQG